MRLCFGDCIFDGGTRELVRAGKALHVPAKTFRLLEVLLERRPDAVSKDELGEMLWPGVFVSDGNLARLVWELRELIDDDAQGPRFIRTIHGFGYAFGGDVSPDGPAIAGLPGIVFKLILRDREVMLHDGENIVGRERDAVAWLDVHSVSRRHARIVVSGDAATLEDLGSKNGTFLKGKPVTHPSPLEDGDLVRIGTVEMVLRRYAGGISTETARSR
jgi:DNA-binding winged helix-turn-helix (wHTH) protein